MPNMEITYDDWFKHYQPLLDRNEEHISFDWTDPHDLEVLKHFPPQCIWTEVACEGNDWTIYSGVHRVNRMDYYITQEEWEENITVRD